MTTFEQELLHVLKQINTSLEDISSNISDGNRQLTHIKDHLDTIADLPNHEFDKYYHLESIDKSLTAICTSIQNHLG